jgi:hypothetical protein
LRSINREETEEILIPQKKRIVENFGTYGTMVHFLQRNKTGIHSHSKLDFGLHGNYTLKKLTHVFTSNRHFLHS